LSEKMKQEKETIGRPKGTGVKLYVARCKPYCEILLKVVVGVRKYEYRVVSKSYGYPEWWLSRVIRRALREAHESEWQSHLARNGRRR